MKGPTHWWRRSLVLALLLTACASPPDITTVSRLVVFGDSNVDTGNLQRLIGDQPMPNSWRGRNCNGPVVSEYLAEQLDARLLTYAVGGATTGKRNLVADLYPDLAHIRDTGVIQQIDQFEREQHRLSGNDLVLVWAGSNDIFQVPTDELARHVATAAGNLEGILERLNRLGAKHIVVATRTVRSQRGSLDDLNGRELNQAFHSVVDQYDGAARVRLFDAYATISDMIQQPRRYGMRSDPEALCVDSPSCSAERYDSGLTIANRYINWDFAHKTTRTHQLMAMALYAQLQATPHPD